MYFPSSPGFLYIDMISLRQSERLLRLQKVTFVGPLHISSQQHVCLLRKILLPLYLHRRYKKLLVLFLTMLSTGLARL